MPDAYDFAELLASAPFLVGNYGAACQSLRETAILQLMVLEALFGEMAESLRAKPEDDDGFEQAAHKILPAIQSAAHFVSAFRKERRSYQDADI